MGTFPAPKTASRFGNAAIVTRPTLAAVVALTLMPFQRRPTANQLIFRLSSRHKPAGMASRSVNWTPSFRVL